MKDEESGITEPLRGAVGGVHLDVHSSLRSDNDQENQQTWLLLWLKFATFTYILLILITLPMFAIGFMAFDAPGSEKKVGAWTAFFMMISVPFWFGGGLWGMWHFYQHEKYIPALVLSVVPLSIWLLIKLISIVERCRRPH